MLVPIVIYILLPVGLVLLLPFTFSVLALVGAAVSFLQEAQLAEMNKSEKKIINEYFIMLKP